MPTDPHSPQVLTSVTSDIEANAIVAALAERGIDATTTGSYTAGFRAEAPGDVNVLVKQENLELSQRALDEIKEELRRIDWSQIDVGQPEA